MRATFCIVLLYITCCLSLHGQSTPDSVHYGDAWYQSGNLDFNLIIAADSGHAQAVLWLLNHGASIHTATEEGVTALMYAAQNGHLEVAKILVLNGADINRKNIDSISALTSAVKVQNEEIADFLLLNGAKPDATDNDQVTSLMYAAANNFVVLTDMLLYYGADPHIRDYEGNDALLAACYNNSIECAELLVAYGATIDTTDRSGNTPLMIAAQKGYAALCDSLLVWGADPRLKNGNGLNALAVAIKSNQPAVVEVLAREPGLVNQKLSNAVMPLDLSNRRDSIYNILKAHGAKRSLQPVFNQLVIGTRLSFNGTDYMHGFFIGLADPKFNIEMKTGWDFRLAAKAILVQEDSSLYYQYWERRSTLFAGLEKSFRLFELSNAATIELKAGYAACFSFGGYRGLKLNAEPIWLGSPSLALQYRKRNFLASGGYRYSNYGLERVSSHRIELSVSGLIPFAKGRYDKKNIYWLNSDYQ